MTDILIVEDDKELSSLLTDFLRAEGYTVSAVESGGKAVDLFQKYGAKLVVLDINLPDVNGFAVCSKLREKADTPILIVSCRTEKEDKLNGFDLGADDYIEKPYDIDILIAKIKGIFKRRYQQDMISADGVTLNLADRTAEIDGEKAELTAKEFDLLALLMENLLKSPVEADRIIALADNKDLGQALMLPAVIETVCRKGNPFYCQKHYRKNSKNNQPYS